MKISLSSNNKITKYLYFLFKFLNTGDKLFSYKLILGLPVLFIFLVIIILSIFNTIVNASEIFKGLDTLFPYMILLVSIFIYNYVLVYINFSDWSKNVLNKFNLAVMLFVLILVSIFIYDIRFNNNSIIQFMIAFMTFSLNIIILLYMVSNKISQKILNLNLFLIILYGIFIVIHKLQLANSNSNILFINSYMNDFIFVLILANIITLTSFGLDFTKLKYILYFKKLKVGKKLINYLKLLFNYSYNIFLRNRKAILIIVFAITIFFVLRISEFVSLISFLLNNKIDLSSINLSNINLNSDLDFVYKKMLYDFGVWGNILVQFTREISIISLFGVAIMLSIILFYFLRVVFWQIYTKSKYFLFYLSLLITVVYSCIRVTSVNPVVDLNFNLNFILLLFTMLILIKVKEIKMNENQNYLLLSSTINSNSILVTKIVLKRFFLVLAGVFLQIVLVIRML